MGLGHRRALTGRSSLSQNQPNSSSNKKNNNDSSRYSRNGGNRFGSKFPFRGEGHGRRSLAMPLLAAAIVLCMVGNQVVLQPRSPSDYAYKYEQSYEEKQKQTQNRDDSDSSQTSEAPHNTNANTNTNTNTNTYKNERALEHNHECTIPRFHIDDDKAWGQLGSTTGPVLLEGWKGFQPNDWTQSELMDHGRAGEFPQYLKDLTVQPLRKKSKTNQGTTETQTRTQHGSAATATATRQLRNSNANENDDDLCVLKGKDVADLLGTSDHEPLLFFTNDQENKPFLDQVKLQTSYEVPSVVQHIDGFRVFSAMHRGKYHSMHSHGESWLGQVSGRRMWWFLPPNKKNKPPRVDACGYLTGAQPVPPGAEKWSCVQNPGEIIWFPKDWLHATCALDDWTVGIGAQQGGVAANRQNFPKLEMEAFVPAVAVAVAAGTEHKDDEDDYHRRKQETLGACLGIGGNDGDDGVVSNTETNNKTQKENKTEKRIETTKENEPTRKKEANNDKEWKWFDGDLNAYYNSLETQIHDRDPSKIASYAVHRWMGPKRSTEEHYELIDRAVAKHHTTTQSALSSSSSSSSKLKVFDAGCGLGSALMFFEKRHPDWDMTGHTISEEQHRFVETKLPKHNFQVNLRSYDEIDATDSNNKKISYDVIYSIEALIHSSNITHTMKEWVDHLEPGGIVVIIDDYVSDGVDKHHDDIQAFSKSWLANVLISPTEFEELAKDVFGLKMVENRDLLAEYEIVKRNYRNQKPVIKPVADRNHQGWMGSKWRQRLTVEGKLSYNMIVLKKNERDPPRRLTDDVTTDDEMCASVPSIITSDEQQQQHASFTEITPQLMSGKGAGGGEKMACISGWYCCNKGFEWYDHLDAHRTDNTAYLKLDRNLFGHYIEVFAKHLNDHYGTYPASASSSSSSSGERGRFLDIGGTGSTASGMTKVTSKFQHFAGPLEYWKLDSDQAAKDLERTLFCDIDDCPAAETCGFDVTFSHTVLEHAKRPWKSFDTIARITKSGGLTMHLVPWSYQYHATPDDNYRFSHKALITLLEDRGFDVLEVGYDICSKPDTMKNRVDEHYDVIWLTYVVGRKR